MAYAIELIRLPHVIILVASKIIFAKALLNSDLGPTEGPLSTSADELRKQNKLLN